MTGARIVHVIDDDPAIRDSLGILLATEGFEVEQHASATSFFDKVSALSRGCVITDVRMPGMSGVEFLAKLKERHFDMPVIVVTAHADVPLAVRAMKLGAVDLLEKPIDDEILLACVRQAFQRMNGKAARTDEIQAIQARLAILTARERQVLDGLLKGYPNKLIAHELGISVRTVEVHRANVMAKMRAGSLSELVRMALLAPRSEGD